MGDALLNNLMKPTIASAEPLPRGIWLPPEYSTQAELIDWPFLFITWICIVFFVGIVIAMVWFMWRYNRARGVAPDHDAATHHTVLEVTWSGIPLILVIAIFYVGFKNYMDLTVAPTDAYQLDVTAQKWSWQFEYPNGHITDELHVPADEPIRLLMKSKDVLHAFFVPDFRVKQDVVPGKYSSVWFQAIYDPAAETKDPQGFAANTHHLFCAEYCGTNHSNMIGTVYVHPDRATYEAWLAKDSVLHGRYEPHEIGDRLMQTRGCFSCHTIDANAAQYPSFKNTWTHVSSGQRQFSEGPPIESTDEAGIRNYIIDSIRNPMHRIVEGYPKAMPVFTDVQLTDQDINAIIAYIKWLQDHDGHPWETAQPQDGAAPANGG